ncbi:MAG: NnrS [Rhizobacter sp.]|nr:NnrS [Rhizobacter sp.]
MHQLEEPPPPARRFALWELGFRPFYLLASVFAAVSIPLWSLQFTGVLPHVYLAGPVWHAHEMLFGFVLAVIVGFLFTAGRNWAMQPTPTGPLLAALSALWIAGRVLVLTPYGWAAAVVNVAFPLAAAVALAVPFYRGRNRRNYFFVGLLVVMALASACVHLAQLGVIELPSWTGLQVGLDVVLFVVSVMTGRVVPMFTNNGVPGARATRHAGVEKAALGLVLVLIVADMFGTKGWPLSLLAAAACAAHAVRWLLWKPWRSIRAPLVWVLHAAYLWVPIHLALRSLAEFGIVTASSATHALTVGAIGGLVIGMMTRTARGHTGRPLRADRFDVACYVLVQLAAIVRVAVPLAMPASLMLAIQCSAILWSCAFALYAVQYGPALTRPRLDGKPG